MSSRESRYTFILGMAAQAFVAGTLSAANLITLCAGQQLLVALIFFIIGGLLAMAHAAEGER